MARIVLDTDVVSYHRAGRLPPGLARLVAASDNTIAFATAGELWKGALDRRWGGARRGGLDLWLDEAMVVPAGLLHREWVAAAHPQPPRLHGLCRARRASAPRRLTGAVSESGWIGEVDGRRNQPEHCVYCEWAGRMPSWRSG